MLNFYQNLSQYVEPVIVSFGSFGLRWYSVMYLVGFFVVWRLLVWRLEKKEGEFEKDLLWKIAVATFVGAIVGGRLGFLFFYDTGFLYTNPLYIFWPFDSVTNSWMGLSGMSFFGALIGAVLAGWILARRLKLDFVQLADFVIPAVPLGYMFGRIGNFLNGELFGKETESMFGMLVQGTLRHPVQLYEAFFEGFVLFSVLWLFRNSVQFRGQMLALFCAMYATIRLASEQFRIEDVRVWCAGATCSMGEFLSIGLLLGGAGMYFWFWSKKDG